MDDSQKSLKYLCSVEQLGEEILSDKQLLLNLDISKNANREALTALRKGNANDKCWMTVAGNFIKMSTPKAIEVLSKEQEKIEFEVNTVRAEMKDKVNRLRDLEFKPQMRGTNLTPLSKNENSALRGNLY